MIIITIITTRFEFDFKKYSTHFMVHFMVSRNQCASTPISSRFKNIRREVLKPNFHSVIIRMGNIVGTIKWRRVLI